jgi:PEP-CTERM motif
MRVLSVCLALVCATATSTAAPILYSINFSGGPTLPSAGSFFYDSGTRQFSSFGVVWNGLNLDLTSSANSPVIDGACASAAPDSEDYFNYLSGSGCASTSWLVVGQQSLPPSDLFRLGVLAPLGSAYAQTFGPGSGTAGLLAGGSFTIRAMPPGTVPEPTSLGLALVGIGALAWRLGKRSAS